MKPLLSLREASYRWKTRTLVRSATLDIWPGRLVVVAGPNGAGKSTLLRMLSGELRPSEGEILIGGERLDAVAPWRLARWRAVMTQMVEISSPFTAAQVVRLGLDGGGKAASASRRRDIIERSLAAVEATEFAGRLYHRLSGGEQRRVQFARALAQLDAGASFGGSQALLLDEPVANLDLRHQIRLLDEARHLARRGVAVLAVLHELNLAARYADVLTLMRGGTIVASGAPAEVLDPGLLSATFGMDLSIAAPSSEAAPLVFPSRWLTAN